MVREFWGEFPYSREANIRSGDLEQMCICDKCFSMGVIEVAEHMLRAP